MPRRNKKNRSTLTVQENGAAPFSLEKEFSFYAAFRSSPFPPPTELEKYDQLCPGISKQFFDNFVNQSNHRMELEKIVVKGDDKRANVSMRNSFIIIMSLIAMSVILFILGKDTPAIASIIGAMVPVVISFINSSAKRKEEREAKRRTMGVASR